MENILLAMHLAMFVLALARPWVQSPRLGVLITATGLAVVIAVACGDACIFGSLQICKGANLAHVRIRQGFELIVATPIDADINISFRRIELFRITDGIP